MVRTGAYRRLLIVEAAHSQVFESQDLPQNSAQYAEVQVQMPGGTRQDLYEYTDELKRERNLEEAAGKGGIEDSTGDPGSNFLWDGVAESKPNAQRSLNGCAIRASLRLLASRLGTEDDPLTHDQENYGTGSTLRAQTVELLDPETCSTYSRESNVNENTTENPLLSSASSTADEPEPATGYDMRGQEGMLTWAKDTADGDFDPAGRATGDRLITQDPRNHGYLNIHSSSDEALLEALVDEEVENGADIEVQADADPKLWNLANQPMGQAG